MTLARAVPVLLGSRSYEVVIGPGVIRSAGARIAPFARRGRVLVAADETVWELHGDSLAAGLAEHGVRHDLVLIPPGEAAKSFARLERLCDELLAAGVDRTDVIVAFGGGVIGDLVGFAAGVIKRGVDFIQIPTTLLAQVDSSVGGKTAINTRAGKNLVGLFHQPRLVLADIGLLASLPIRERRAGLAEVIKYGLIDDAEFFVWVERHATALSAGDPDLIAEAVARSVAAKARIVAMDEREEGLRALLNLGHTFAHALEAEAGMEGLLLHGEAVGCGLSLAHDFSERAGFAPRGTAARVDAALLGLGLEIDPRRLPGAPFAVDRLMASIRHDKKSVGGRLVFVLSRGVGEAFLARDVAAGEIEEFWRERAG
jgi:3-dehydroquinate synthase